MNLKKFALFITLLILNCSTAFSCGFYPYGEEIRYNFLKPKYVFSESDDYFFYTSNLFSNEYYGDIPSATHFGENCDLWAKTFGNKFTTEEVYDLIYHKSSQELKTSKEQIVLFLHEKENLKYLNYLLFAKSVSDLNGETADPWEMEERSVMNARQKAWTKALKLAKAEKEEVLKRRYAHLAIRLAFYNDNKKVVDDIYATYFNDQVYNDAIDYWALHFKLHFEPESPERNVKIALVFLNSVEKRNSIFRLKYDYYEIKDDLDAATSDLEKTAVLYMYACRQQGNMRHVLEKISEYDPQLPELDFLALREVNKFEDWIMTPYYTNFNWMVYNDGSEEAAEGLKMEMKSARQNAKLLYDWMKKTGEKRTNNKVWWNLMADYTLLLSGGKLNSENIRSKFTDDSYTADQQQFLKKMYLLNVFSNDEDPEVKNETVQQLLMTPEIQTDQKLLIGLAKELERHGHIEISAAFFSKVNQSLDESRNYTDYYGVWRTDNLAETVGDNIYYDYFTYLDATLNTSQVQSLIYHVEYKKLKTDFDEWLYGRIKNESTRLYDMLGTMYMRKNDLKSALSAFNQVNDTLWTSGYFPYQTYIGDNPFSNDFYGKNDARHEAEIEGNYTKPKIVAELIKQINIVNTATGDKKALAAFKVANCYRNMTFYGNSWMMKRYYWTLNANLTGLEDDEEYFQCLTAQKYYGIAEQSATKKEFKLVSLIMKGQCEKYEMSYEDGESWLSYGYYDYREVALLDKLNPSYKKIRKEYDNYSYAIGFCDAYEGYFKSIATK